MSNALLHHVAIASESSRISFDDVATVAAAVSKQVARDFGPAWGIQATVQAFPSLESVPSDYYQVILVDDDKMPHAAGYHTDLHGQPLAVVEVAGNWPLAVSHETLEMLADPSGNRIVAAMAPAEVDWPQLSDVFNGFVGDLPRVDYLVEACDPVEGRSYYVNGVPVSDFVFPDFYSSSACSDKAAFGGNASPRAVRNGYITFRDPSTALWYQIFRTPGSLSAHKFSAPPLGASLREHADHAARTKRVGRPESAHMRFEFRTEHAARTRSTIKKASMHGGSSAK